MGAASGGYADASSIRACQKELSFWPIVGSGPRARVLRADQRIFPCKKPCAENGRQMIGVSQTMPEPFAGERGAGALS
jgi:hypothetical protein